MLLDELGAYLATLGVGTVGTDLFLGQTPDGPDACVTVREYPGEATERTLGPAVAYEQPRIQIEARAASYKAARTKAEAIFQAVDVAEKTLGGVHYLRIEPLQSPFPMGRDENNRWLCGFNCAIQKELS